MGGWCPIIDMIYCMMIYIYEIFTIYSKMLMKFKWMIPFFRQLVSACCMSPVNLHPVAHRRSARGLHGERLGIRVDDWCLWCQGHCLSFPEISK